MASPLQKCVELGSSVVHGLNPFGVASARVAAENARKVLQTKSAQAARVDKQLMHIAQPHDIASQGTSADRRIA